MRTPDCRHPTYSFAPLLAAVAALTLAVALPAAAQPPAMTDLIAGAAAHDIGPTAASQTITTSVILKIKHQQDLANFIQATVTPGDPHYQHFLSVAQFRARFAPSDQEVQQVTSYLQSYGITVNKVYADNLDIEVAGTAAQFNAAFSTEIHDYVKNGRLFHRPVRQPQLAGVLSKLVLGVPGLNNETGRLHPTHVQLGQGVYAQMTPPPVAWPKNSTATGIPQEYTVGDVANFYQVNPLYQAGIKGQGRTIGIMTFANFNVSDVASYWSDIGLKVKANRIKKILVDGGRPVEPNTGTIETSLDVEQAGGMAPFANIRVYIGPNTLNADLDVFYTAVSENKADTVSISWGGPEELLFPALNGGVDYTFVMVAHDQALMEGAAQGQSFFAASGDAGAYDVNDPQEAPYPLFSMQLTVDQPANDPYITAAGGTTVAATIPGIPQFGCPSITIQKEQVWGFDFLQNAWGACLGLPPNALFPVGGGGGVSSYFPLPYYQQFTPGITQTQLNQSLICETVAACSGLTTSPPPQILITLPTNFAGRNMPDLSLNADPVTGYIVVDCVDFSTPPCATTGVGGTSFVAPQLNGITALIDQAAGSRVGLLNPVIYAEQSLFGYGKLTPFNDITAGDNWFYYGIPGYDNGAGIGTINATNLALTYVFLNSLNFSR